MQKPVATLVLNRNLGGVTDRLVEHLQKFDGDICDIIVIESGSEEDKRSKYPGYQACWKEAMENGLRYGRGFNFGLASLLENGKYENYEYFFLVWNNSVFFDEPTTGILLEQLVSHPKMGIISPCDAAWGEYRLIPENESRVFWYGTHVAWLMRRSFIDTIREFKNPGPMNFLYDGTNFRGYYSDVELIGKAYVNDFAYAVTRKTCFKEIRNYKEKYQDLMRTETTEVNQDKMYQEGMAWLRRKYGFQSHWNMLQYVKAFYDIFLSNNPGYSDYKI